MDLYNFIKQLFHRKLLAFGINPDDPFGAPVNYEGKEKTQQGVATFEQAFGEQQPAASPENQQLLALQQQAAALQAGQLPGLAAAGGQMPMALPGMAPAALPGMALPGMQAPVGAGGMANLAQAQQLQQLAAMQQAAAAG